MNLKFPLIPSRFAAVLAIAPVHFISLQFLEALSSILEHTLETYFKSQPILAGLVFFPVFCIASCISNSLTYVSVRQVGEGTLPTFGESWKKVSEVLGMLILSSLVLGLVFVLGIMVFILPALFLMALYLFVPHLILTEKGLPLSVYLFRSTRISKKSYWQCFFTVVGAVLLGLATYLLAETLGTWAGGLSQNETTRIFISVLINVFFSVLSAMVVDTWIALLFLKLKEAP